MMAAQGKRHRSLPGNNPMSCTRRISTVAARFLNPSRGCFINPDVHRSCAGSQDQGVSSTLILLYLFLLCPGQYIGEGDFLHTAEQCMSVQFAAAQPG
jgi:hypothetical protein